MAVQHSEHVEVSTICDFYISFQLCGLLVFPLCCALTPQWWTSAAHTYLAAVALQGQSNQSLSLSLCFLATLCWQCLHAGEHGTVWLSFAHVSLTMWSKWVKGPVRWWISNSVEMASFTWWTASLVSIFSVTTFWYLCSTAVLLASKRYHWYIKELRNLVYLPSVNVQKTWHVFVYRKRACEVIFAGFVFCTFPYKTLPVSVAPYNKATFCVNYMLWE